MSINGRRPAHIRKVLITGGAGFIGSHLADELLAHGYAVRALDNLDPQVHGERRRRPTYLAPEVDLQIGDVRDPSAVTRALDGVDAVFHFAAAVGVGQSMYDIEHYTSVNNLGTAVLFEKILDKKRTSNGHKNGGSAGTTTIKRFIVASSMSVYGEGLYRDVAGLYREGVGRSLDQLRRGEWELRDDEDLQGRSLVPVATPESKLVSLESIYALSKFDQERMSILLGRAYEIPTTALRFFNVYGPRQALSNPYTGVLAIFASRLLNHRAPVVFEDGKQQRDFVSVKDVARACRLTLEAGPEANGQVINIGSGQPRTITEIALRMTLAIQANKRTSAASAANDTNPLAPEITGKYRMGDVRHCFADIALAKRLLGYEPTVDLRDGLAELTVWLRDQVTSVNVPTDRAAEARAELDARGLTL